MEKEYYDLVNIYEISEQVRIIHEHNGEILFEIRKYENGQLFGVLFADINDHRNKTIASVIERSIVFDIDERSYDDFINDKISVRELIKLNEKVKIFDHHYIKTLGIQTMYISFDVLIEDLHPSYLPHENIYYSIFYSL